MAMNIDNSEVMSSDDIKKILINTFNKAITKSVQDAKYDKTILATIQYCTDATIGQYKIKYQNGYFTAYSQDTSAIYSNGAAVYITVPENNFNNRLIISGLATSDSSAKTYVTNLEGDQQYMQKGPNLISMKPTVSEIQLSSFIGVAQHDPQLIPIFTRDKTQSSVDMVDIGTNGEDNPLSADSYLKTADGAFRFGATFRTAIPENKQYTGDYGIRLGLRFMTNNDKSNPQYEVKYYEINTITMTGTPFNYYVAMPQYNYWEIDTDSFDRIESIVAYCRDFSGEYHPEYAPDIFITDINLYGATKLYDTNNDKYKVEIVAEQGYKFEAGTEITSLPFSAKLRVDGNEVKSIEEQGLKYFWAKEDATVNSTSNKRYNRYTGKGWKCLNEGYATVVDGTLDPQALQDYVIEDDTDLTHIKAFAWKEDEKAISLKKSACKGRITKLKCVIVYNNTPISAVIEVYNEDGIYLVMDATNTEFYGGIGTTNITAGAFKDGAGGTLINVTLPNSESQQQSTYIDHYIWTITDALGQAKEIPPTDPNELIKIKDSRWDETHIQGSIHNDDETVSDANVETWLVQQPIGFSVCKQRYDYYSKQYNYYASVLQDDEATQEEKDAAAIYLPVCERRRDGIVTDTKTNINKMYSNLVENSTNSYIFGPSAVTAQYIEGAEPNYNNVEITNVTNYYYSEIEHSDYQEYIDVHNTLFNLTASMVGVNATVTVTAVDNDGEAVASNSVYLQAAEATNLDYSLEIVNGTQSFVYTAGGIAPTDKNVSAPITLKPLYYRLYDKAGNLIYDSENADSEGNQTNNTSLDPVWTFYAPSRSMIQTVYQGHTNWDVSPDDATVYFLKHEDKFVYTLAENFDIRKRDESNIQLRVTYEDNVIYGATNFTFIKEGELGTNGTNTYLDIIDPTYEAYRTSVLTSCSGAIVKEMVDGVEVENHYSPADRHIHNTYLYATQAYHNNGSPAEKVSTVDFVNLKFARMASQEYPNDPGVIGDSTIQLYGQWYENGLRETIGEDSKWDTMEGEGYAIGGYMCSQPPFAVTSNGAYANVQISYVANVPATMAYKPTTVNNFIPRKRQILVNRTANNIVKVEAGKQIAEQKDGEGNPIVRKNYGYYTMPYFFYHNSINTPTKLDPAKHIIIVGGFDEVVYDSAGLNPEYDKEHPFKFFLIDENGENITEEFLAAIQADSTKGEIQWKCSPGFSFALDNGITTIKAYPEGFGYNEDLYSQYCSHKSKVYKCIKSHTKPSMDYNITDGKGNVIKRIQRDDFIADYWEEVDSFAEKKQEFKITPNSTYESVAQSTLFNSWVSLYILYNRGDKGIIEAEALIPINVICNRYGSEILNGWNGKTTEIGDAYVLSNKVAAGRKYEDNSFLGVTIGENMYIEDDRDNEVGLFGYGRIDENDPNSWARTLFLDAKTGRTILGPVGSSQIVLDPTPQEKDGDEVWSKLNGWYISPNFFYKPLGEANPLEQSSSYAKKNELFSGLSQGGKITPPTVKEGSAGMYVPWFGEVSKDDVFLWASSKVKNLNNESLENEIRSMQTSLHTSYGINFDDNTMNMRNDEAIRATKEAAVRTAKATAEAKYATWKTLEKQGAPKADIEAAKAEYGVAAEALLTAQQNLAKFNSDTQTYEDILGDYHSLIYQETTGDPTQYTDFNSKKSNFYVTYGGHLHATSASIEGNIIANSGRFGNGSNKISIAVTKDNVKYILYNKNFWVRDSSGDENEESAIYMKGKIMAKSGQFGQVGDDKDGYSANTVFIEYNWYPWHVPGDHEDWNDQTYYLDTTAGRSKKYALYHKNFNITNTGDVFFNGELYTRKGRIGNWVITKNNLHSADGNIVLSSNSIQLGVFSADSAGNLRGGNGAWYINADGTSSFSKMQGLTFTNGSGFSMSGDNLKLALKAGDTMQIGDGYLYATSDGEGMVFDGRILFNDNINLKIGRHLQIGNMELSKNHLKFGTTSTVEVSSTGFSIGGQGAGGGTSLTTIGLTVNGNTIIQSNGDLDCRSSVARFASGSAVYIGGTMLDAYIQSKVDAAFNNLYGLTSTAPDGHSHTVTIYH